MTERRTIEPTYRLKSAMLLIVFLMIASGLNSSRVVSQDILESPEAIAIISSRFMLWDISEKMLDPQFTINMFNLNQSVNSSVYYEITINNNMRNGTFYSNHTINYDINYTEIIFLMTIKLNNITTLEAENIRLIDGLDGTHISTSREPFFLSFTPWEWTAKERNIFFAVLISGLVSSLVSFRLVKRYRKYSGYKVIK